jgi:hypothetical protein
MYYMINVTFQINEEKDKLTIQRTEF